MVLTAEVLSRGTVFYITFRTSHRTARRATIGYFIPGRCSPTDRFAHYQRLLDVGAPNCTLLYSPASAQHRPAAECGGESPAEILDDDHRSQDEDRGSSIGLPPEVAKNVDLEDDENDKDHEGGHKMKKGKGKGSDDLGVESDAQLSCPLCFTTVCLECQRHVRYLNQVGRGAGEKARKGFLQ